MGIFCVHIISSSNPKIWVPRNVGYFGEFSQGLDYVLYYFFLLDSENSDYFKYVSVVIFLPILESIRGY